MVVEYIEPVEKPIVSLRNALEGKLDDYINGSLVVGHAEGM